MIEGSPPQSVHNRGTQLRSRPLPTNRHTAQKHNASTGPTRKNGIPRSSSHPHFPDWTIHPFSLHCPWKRSRAWIPRPPPTHSYPATIPTKKTWRNGGNCTVRTNSLLRSDRFRRQACTPTPSHHSPQQFQQHTNRIHSHAKEEKHPKRERMSSWPTKHNHPSLLQSSPNNKVAYSGTGYPSMTMP